jgi:hypothetical protein
LRRVRWVRNPLNEDEFLNSSIILSFIEEYIGVENMTQNYKESLPVFNVTALI